MKDPRTLGNSGPAMTRGFRLLLVVCGILLVVMVALLYMSRPSQQKSETPEAIATTPVQPEVPAGFVPETTNVLQLASAETETPVVSNQAVVTNNTFVVDLDLEFQKGQRMPKQQTQKTEQ